jgi:hypothetical protein
VVPDFLRGIDPIARRAAQSAGVLGYEGVAHLAAHGLQALPNVRSVLLTGSLTRTMRVAPGYSDIDLVVQCSLNSTCAELDLLGRLARVQGWARRLGPLFYNVDYVDEADLPFIRAFGDAWGIRLDRHGRTLSGVNTLTGRVQRPRSELRFEQLSLALRRWTNTGAWLLDPTVRARRGARLRAAGRLLTDLIELWLDPDDTLSLRNLLHRASKSQSRSATFPSLLETPRLSESDIGPLVLPACLEVLDAFARELAHECRFPFRVRGQIEPFEPPPELPSLERLLGGPFESVALLRRGPHAREYLPVVLASENAEPAAAIVAAFQRLSAIAPALTPLSRWSRRPVPFTQAMWSVAAMLEPAPFTGAAATCPVWSVGKRLPPPAAPSTEALQAMLRARALQAMVMLRSMELRAGRSAEHIDRSMQGWWAILDAVETTGAQPTLDVSWKRDAPPVPTRHERIDRVRRFSEDTRARLRPLLAKRGMGSTG